MISFFRNHHHVIAATLLVAGTCVGGGMLALPVDTSSAGFIPAVVSMFFCWLFMMITGLLYVEVALWMEEGTHVMTMSERLLGFPGKIASLILFLFMGYASLVAYTTGGAFIMESFFLKSLMHEPSHALNCLFFTLIFGSLFFLSTKFLGRINATLVFGMIGAYIGLVAIGTTEVDMSLLNRSNFKEAFVAFPILLTVFSYQIIVPTLVTYVQRDVKVLKRAIFWGTTIPFIAYILWEWIVLGSVPHEGDPGLLQAYELGQGAIEPFRKVVKHPYLILFADFFAFFAIITSYLGIGLGLFDFLADSLKQAKKGVRKFGLVLLITIPSLLFAIIFPKAFRYALEITGGFGDALLGGVLPACMVLSGRYWQKREGAFRVMGGKPLLSYVLLFSLFIILIQVINLL